MGSFSIAEHWAGFEPAFTIDRNRTDHSTAAEPALGPVPISFSLSAASPETLAPAVMVIVALIAIRTEFGLVSSVVLLVFFLATAVPSNLYRLPTACKNLLVGLFVAGVLRTAHNGVVVSEGVSDVQLGVAPSRYVF